MDLRDRVSNIADLQRKLGVKSYDKVFRWLSGTLRITAERAIQIEAITGGSIRRWELRPDLWPSPGGSDSSHCDLEQAS